MHDVTRPLSSSAPTSSCHSVLHRVLTQLLHDGPTAPESCGLPPMKLGSALSSPLAALRAQLTGFSTLTATPESSPSRYQPLRQSDDSGDIGHHRNHAQYHGHHGTGDGDGTGDVSDASHRDAAAMMLLKLGRSPSQRLHVSPDDNARVLRRIDLALLPLMLAVYFLHALDKATLSYASVFGLIEDTNLEGDQFSWLGSVVFLAQLVMQLPVAWALVKLPIGTFTSLMVLGWGITLSCMTWAHSFQSLLGSRFFLGAFEASVGPSFVAITQMWWRRR